MALSEWLPLVFLFMAGGLTPGPAVIFTIASSLRYGFRLALMSALGVCFANLIWLVLAATGAGLVLKEFPTVFIAIQIIGVVFIIWIAWNMAVQPINSNFDDDVKDVFGTNARSRPRYGRIAALFFRGVGLQLANPNALIYFGALLPAFFVAERSISSQVLIMAATVTATELIGLSIYAGIARLSAHAFSNERFARIFYISAAVLMVLSVTWAVFG